MIDAKYLYVRSFKEKYADSGRPLLIKNAAKNWKAMDTFNFEFFRNLQNVEEDNFEECFFHDDLSEYHFKNFQVLTYTVKYVYSVMIMFLLFIC